MYLFSEEHWEIFSIIPLPPYHVLNPKKDVQYERFVQAKFGVRLTREGPLGPPLVVVEVRVSAEDGEEGVRQGAALQRGPYLYDVHLQN